MKKKDLNIVLDNLREIKGKLTIEHILNNTSVLRGLNDEDKQRVAKNLDLWLSSWITTKINESIELLEQ